MIYTLMLYSYVTHLAASGYFFALSLNWNSFLFFHWIIFWILFKIASSCEQCMPIFYSAMMHFQSSCEVFLKGSFFLMEYWMSHLLLFLSGECKTEKHTKTFWFGLLFRCVILYKTALLYIYLQYKTALAGRSGSRL